MIFDAADEDRIAFELAQDAAHVRKQVTPCRWCEHGRTVFGAENGVDDYVGEGLRLLHSIAPSGLMLFWRCHPGLAAWAVSLRPFGAAS